MTWMQQGTIIRRLQGNEIHISKIIILLCKGKYYSGWNFKDWIFHHHKKIPSKWMLNQACFINNI